MGYLLYIIAVILIIGWLIGFVGFHAGGLIHILLVIAVIQSSPGSDYKTRFNLGGSARGIFLIQVQQGDWLAAGRMVLE